MSDCVPAVNSHAEQWPLIERKFRIPDNDYARSYGYWRGNAYDKVSPVEAAHKFVRSELQLKMCQKRMEVQRDKARGKEPLEWEARSAHPIKLARGEPVAQDILPFTGERGMRSLAGLHTHRCRPPAFPEPDDDEPRALTALSNLSRDSAVSQPAQTAHQHGGPTRKHQRGRMQGRGMVQSHLLKPRSYSETENLWKAPEFSNGMVHARVFQRAGLVVETDGTLTSVPTRIASVDQEFDQLTVRELITRSVEPGQRNSRGGTACSRLPSAHLERDADGNRAEFLSSASCGRSGTPAWAKAPRKNTRIIGNPSSMSSTCIIQPQQDPGDKLDLPVKIADSWMTRVPNLGRVTDPFCVHLASQPLYCFNLEQARHGREAHMISGLGVSLGGPVYNIRASQAIQM